MTSGVDCNENSREVTREVWDEEAEEEEDRFCPLLATDNLVSPSIRGCKVPWWLVCQGLKGFGRRFTLPRSKGQTYFWQNMGVCKMRFVHEALLSAKKPCVLRSMQTKCRSLFTRINRLARQIVRDKMNCGVFFVSSPLACLGSMAKGSRAGT